jgi:hypothetical protein
MDLQPIVRFRRYPEIQRGSAGVTRMRSLARELAGEVRENHDN